MTMIERERAPISRREFSQRTGLVGLRLPGRMCDADRRHPISAWTMLLTAYPTRAAGPERGAGLHFRASIPTISAIGSTLRIVVQAGVYALR
jgi:hypothetical protein